MRVLVFQPTIVGHYLEYLHHLFMMANHDNVNEYIFVVPREFDEKKHLFEWDLTNNITVDLLSDDDFFYSRATDRPLVDSLHICRTTRKYAKKHSCNIIFSANIVTYLPMAPFVLGGKFHLIGIIYKIYLRGNNAATFRLNNILNIIKYFIYARFNVFNRLLVLNDTQSALALNTKYHTSKFWGVADPFVLVNTSNSVNIRKRYNISEDKKIFVHFGGLSKRKGTHIILDSIDWLSESEASKYVFIIAGVAGDSIKDYIEQRIHEISHKTTIIFENRFCEYEYLAGLCKCCNAILIPYQQTDLSSGLLGYANQFAKPVVGPKGGLIGSLIESYSLGITIDAKSSMELAKTYSQIENIVCDKTNEYCKLNNISGFTKRINDALNNVAD